MPKLKTHHWAGNLPLKTCLVPRYLAAATVNKNILHWAGIDNAIPINAAVKPDFAIVAGSFGGRNVLSREHPLQSPFGDDPVMVDATRCRVMGFAPERIKYLAAAGTMLGHINVDKIQQLGESIEDVKSVFAVLPEFANIRQAA
jgi:hypothetical protein